MKNLNFLKLFFGIMLMMVSTTFVGCVDDNDDTEAPYLEVSPTTLVFTTSGTPADGSQSYFEISTNRAWTAVVNDNKSWVTLSAIQGDGSTRVNVSIPAGINDEAVVEITISNKVGPLKKEYVTIKSGDVVEAEVVYHTNIGDVSVSSPFPYVDAYTDWNATGTGASTVTYSGQKATVRASGLSNSGSYNGASGPNVVFFGALPTDFEINNITLTSAQTNLKLTFGASSSVRDDATNEYNNTFDISKFTVSLSANGTSWTPLPYTINNGDQESPYWVFATTDFTLTEAVSSLYIKFTSSVASAIRLDDITLQTGNGGQSITLSGGTTPPTGDGEAVAVTIPELISTMTATSEVINANADCYFEAVVQNDVTGGNYSFNNLILATEGATTAGNGITLYGSQVEPSTLGLNMGDKVKVTLIKGLAKSQIRNGLYQATGAATDTWAKIEKLNGTATITPIVITPDKLADYQSMTVTIQNATTATAGIWANTSAISSHTFSANSTNFTVFCKKDATAFNDVPYSVATGSISGLSSVYNNSAQLVPRDLNDVSAFLSASPTITAINPTSLTFAATGGSQTIEVSISNQGSNALSVSGLSGILSASVIGTTVTVVATENTGDAVNQTLTITLANGNSVTAPISVSAQGGSTPAGYSLISTLSELTAGKYLMAGLVSSLAPYDYQLWTGATSADGTNTNTNSDLVTVSYQFANNELTPEKAADVANTEVELIAVSGKANTYYIMVGGKYLYNSVNNTNRRLFFTDDASIAEWVFANKSNGTGLCPSNNATYLMTASATYNYLRTYKTETQNSVGIFFFKKNN